MTDNSHDLAGLIEECGAIVTLFRCIPEYRRGFIKGESPDWHMKPSVDAPSIGLEVVHAYSQAEIQLYLRTKDVSTIEQASKKAIEQEFDQPGILYFVKYVDGCAHYLEYIPNMDMVISKDDDLIAILGPETPWIYTKMDECSKKALSKYVLIGRRATPISDELNKDLSDTYEFDCPHFGSLRIAFAEKLAKLNKNYNKFSSYHLAIIYDGSIPDSESPLRRLMKSMMMIQEGCDRAFNRVYIIHYQTIIEFDLDHYKMKFHDNNLDRWDALRIQKLVIGMTTSERKNIDAEMLYNELPDVDITTDPQYIRHLKN